MKSLFLDNTNLHKEWEDFLTKEVRHLVIDIESEVSQKSFTPAAEKVLRFLEMPLNELKVIILGQDPYPQPGVATGRSFEVATLDSWYEPFRNISLKNILRALYQAYTNQTVKFSELKEKIDNEFPLLPPGKLFGHWEAEGVLLLNTSYTCETGKPGSHRQAWEVFTDHVLYYLQRKSPNATWFLWGSHAVEATKNLQLKNTIVTHHPMMCYDRSDRKKDFLFGEVNCFREFIPEIDWTGYALEKGLKTTGTLF